MSGSGNAARRSEARERRRASRSSEPGSAANGTEGALQVAGAAAAAAAVGAALGAVRALTTRNDGGDDAGRDEESAPEDMEPVADDESPEAEAVPQEEPDDDSSRDDVGRPARGAAPDAVRSIASRAREQLRDLHGGEAESVSALERIGDGWRVTLEVVEVERVPNSTDVLATFAVELDGDGQLMRYERVRRYYRAQADLGGGE